MFNVIRIPTKYSKTISRFSDQEKSLILDTLINIWNGIPVEVPNSIIWDTIFLIFGDWMNMENKNWVKVDKLLIRYRSELPEEVIGGSWQIVSESLALIVKDSIVKDSIVKENSKPPKISFFEESSFEYQISKFFLYDLLTRKTACTIYLLTRKSEEDILQLWADEVRKMLEIDKFTEAQIDYVIKFACKDEFRSTVILTMMKFREKNKKLWVPHFIILVWKIKEFQQNKVLTADEIDSMSPEEIQAYKNKKWI